MPDSLAPDPAGAGPRISRRGFLVGTSLAVVGAGSASVAGFVWLTQGPRIDLAALGADPLSVGYVEGSGERPRASRARWIEDGLLAGARVIPAAALRIGSGDLAGRLVRFTVHGLHARDQGADGTTLAVDVHVASPDPTAPYAFHAWSRRSGPTPSLSGRANFQVVLDRDPRLAITLERMTATGRALTGALFGIGSGQDVVRLRPGAYLLGLTAGAWDRAVTLPADGRAVADTASILVTVEPLAS